MTTSTTPEGASPTPVGAGVSSEDRRAVETLYASFAGRPELLDDAVAEDWQDIPLLPGQDAGREGMKPMITGFRASFPDLAVTVHEMFGDGAGRVAVRGEMTGTHRGEFMGVAPTGRAFTVPIHEFHRVAGGRVTHTWHLEDWFGWLNQVGAWPAAPATSEGSTR